MIYLVMIDGSKLTEPQHHRLLDEILCLGKGTREADDDERAGVPPLPLKYNAVDATFETVRSYVGEAVDKLLAVPPQFPRPVVCAWCGNRHRSVVPFETSTQGDNCAASVFQATVESAEMLTRAPNQYEHHPPTIAAGEWLVKGHYGSSGYDCDLYRFVKNAPTAPASPVCDNCIGERSSAGDLVQIEGHYP